MAKRNDRVLIIVQNLPVPLDRRVWEECHALLRAGIGVSVICPKGPGDPWYQRIDGVRIYKYPPPPAATGVIGYAFEFGYCWLLTALLSIVAFIRDGFRVIQACNPPDTYWALALPWRLFGVRFVYDQHDLNPEVFLSRFGEPSGLGARAQLAVIRWLEAMTYRTADQVISTNESYRRIALSRGHRDPATVTVVRSGPDTTTMRPLDPLAELRGGGTYLAVYLGIMGPQDGVDLALRSFARLVDELGRKDCHFALLGFGDCLADLRKLAVELNVEDLVTFTGRVNRDQIADYLSTADVGICPDPKSPLNDVSTMNKTMEYMAYCLPIVSFDLVETRVSAGEAAIYVPSEDIAAMATAWARLLDDPQQRVERGLFGRNRVVAELDWAPQSHNYVGVYHRMLGRPDAAQPTIEAGTVTAAPTGAGRPYIDLDDRAALQDYVAHRGRTC